MRTLIVFGAFVVGCAGPAAVVPARQVSFAVSGPSSALAGEARVLEARWNRSPGTQGAASKDALLQPSRVSLEDGRSCMAWIEPNVEWGNRALAQYFDANGAPMGAPVVISPDGMEVVGALEASVQGDSVEIAFAACDGHHMQKMAVSLNKP